MGSTSLAVAAGAFGSLDTALNVAFPDLVADFDLSVGQLQWVVVCFVLVSGGLLLPAGALGDVIGHDRTALAGAMLSTVAMLGCALAPGFGWFLAGRVVQGVGTAAVMASAPALATQARVDGRRDLAVARFQTSSAAGLAAGPVIGGLMVLLLGWRGVFWFRVPLAVALVVLAFTVGASRRTRAPSAVAAGSDSDQQAPSPVGAGSATVDGPAAADGRRSALVAVSAAATATAVVNGAMFATWLLLPLVLVDRMGRSVIAAGLVLAVSPLATAIASSRAGSMTGRWSSSTVALMGLAVLITGMGILAAVMLSASEVMATLIVVVGLGLVGAGLGLFAVPNMALVMEALPAHRQGVGGALSLMMRTLGIVVGVRIQGELFDNIEGEAGFDTAYQSVFGLSVVALLAAALLVGTASTVGVARRPAMPSSV